MGRARCGVEAALLEFLSGRGLRFGDAVGVAYSGGPDSAALLAALSSIGWRSPIAVHVDHGIRGREELDGELAIIKKVCLSLGARLLVARVRPGAVLERARASGEGLESAARRYRYAAFREAMRRSGTTALLLAHTMDDQIETLLMRMFAGSGAGGMKGIPEARGPFMRPFLGIEKAALLSYLDVRGIAYSSDSTNVSGDFLRNKVRRTLVPALDLSFPGWRKGLASTAAKAALDEAALSAAADALPFSPSPLAPNEYSLSAEELLKAPESVALRSLVRASGKLLGSERFPFRAALAALSALRGGEGSRYRGAGLELSIEGGSVALRRSSAFPERGGLDFPKVGGYFVLIDRPRRVRVGSLVVRAAWAAGGNSGIRSDAFRFPLVVRSRRPGDSIALEQGNKRLDALFSEWALPERARRAVPVVEDRDGIVAVLGAGSGGKDRYRARAPSGECGRNLSIIVKGA